MRYAVAVADELHFGRAAARLLITEQTLSAQIKNLELRLGVALFIRDRRHVELTPEGELLVERGRRLLAEADDLLVEIVQNPAPLLVDVMTEGSLPSAIMGQVQGQLRDMPLEIRQSQGLSACLGGVVSGGIGLAFGRVRGMGRELSPAVAYLLIRLEPIGVALPEGHPLAGKDQIRPADLAGFPLLHYSPHEALGWQDWQDEFATAFGIEVTQRVYGHGHSAAHRAVAVYGEAGLSTLGPEASDGVVVRPLADPVPLFPWSVVWRASRRDPRVARVIGLMEKLAAAGGWLVPPAEPWWLPDVDRADLPG